MADPTFTCSVEDEDKDAWFRRQVQAGLDSANAGRLNSADDVEAKFADRRAETLRELGG